MSSKTLFSLCLLLAFHFTLSSNTRGRRINNDHKNINIGTIGKKVTPRYEESDSSPTTSSQTESDNDSESSNSEESRRRTRAYGSDDSSHDSSYDSDYSYNERYAASYSGSLSGSSEGRRRTSLDDSESEYNRRTKKSNTTSGKLGTQKANLGKTEPKSILEKTGKLEKVKLPDRLQLNYFGQPSESGKLNLFETPSLTKSSDVLPTEVNFNRF